MAWKQVFSALWHNKPYWSFWLTAFAFLWGVLGTQHYRPDSTGLSINLYVSMILGIATACGLWFFRPQTPSRQTLLWLVMFLLIVIQPVLHQLAYVDTLIFPLSCLFLCASMAYAFTGLQEKQRQILADVLAYMLLIAGCITILTQFIQALNLEAQFYPYVFPKGSNRLTGNIAQVNQAVFLVSMALATLPYFYYTRPKSKWHNLAYVVAAFWLSIGFGFAASRGGLFLGLAAVFGSALFYAQALRQRLLVVSILFILAISGYFLGTYLLNLWVAPEMSAVGRLVSGNQNLRLSQLAQAWHAFSHHPFTGVGYGMIKGHGIHHAEEIPWFTIGHHVHNIVGQIAAELGLLGLTIFGGFIWLLLRNWQIRGMASEKGLAYAILLIIGLYSLSEYPLWYLRFMLLVPICIALIDPSTVRWNAARWRVPAAVICVLISLASIHYIERYRWYTMIYTYVIQEEISNEDRITAFHDLPIVFGYSSYRDMMLYAIADYDMAHLQQHIALGERALQVHFSQETLIKQADLYVLAGNLAQAGKYYRAACVWEFSRHCHQVIKTLDSHVQTAPEVFNPPRQAFAQWYQQRFGQPMPTTLPSP